MAGEAKMSCEFESFKELFSTAKSFGGGRWCVKDQRPYPIQRLKTEVCFKCEECIINGGICDPI